METHLRHELVLYVGLVTISSYIEEKGKLVSYYLENPQTEKRLQAEKTAADKVEDLQQESKLS